jgi:NADH-quinone oxidoreductase subunit M
LGTYISFPDLLIWLPLLAGVIALIDGRVKQARIFSMGLSIATLVVAVISLFYTDNAKYLTYNNANYYWLKYLGANYYIGLDGMGRLMALLTALGFPIILFTTTAEDQKRNHVFYALMMFTQAGLMGVFLAMDALTFYFFWELALIPVYFLCSQWGGEKRIQATFKFFVYTFAGSLLMLIGIIYLYLHTATRVLEDGTVIAHTFSLNAFYNLQLSPAEQNGLFALFMLAFAIKMPIFPFHTWQPDAYDQSPTSVTMILSGIMVKMGLFGVIRWLIPILPKASIGHQHIIITLSVIGIVYASLLAWRQDNIKKLIAYSSIAHIGLMSATLFSMQKTGMQGVLLQMFNHGINIIGMWVVVDMIERRTGIKKISELGGLAHSMPFLTVAAVIISLANIALPLTNGFPGEFMMFAGLYRVNIWYAVVAGLGIILSAVYTLNMIQKVFYGTPQASTSQLSDANAREKTLLIFIVALIVVIGIYPQAIMQITDQATNNWFLRIK